VHHQETRAIKNRSAKPGRGFPTRFSVCTSPKTVGSSTLKALELRSPVLHSDQVVHFYGLSKSRHLHNEGRIGQGSSRRYGLACVALSKSRHLGTASQGHGHACRLERCSNDTTWRDQRSKPLIRSTIAPVAVTTHKLEAHRSAARSQANGTGAPPTGLIAVTPPPESAVDRSRTPNG
jgi:hypothetical protein